MIYYSDSRRLIELDPSRVHVWLSMVGGIVLNLLPYPDVWFAYKPDFVALILVIWALRLRRPVSFTMVSVGGILMDVSYTAFLGQHVFAYCVLLAVATVFRGRYAIAGQLHRAVFMLIALSASIATSLLVAIVYDSATFSGADFFPALTGTAIWLLLPLLLALSRRREPHTN